jgi:hypothetical protein
MTDPGRRIPTHEDAFPPTEDTAATYHSPVHLGLSLPSAFRPVSYARRLEISLLAGRRDPEYGRERSQARGEV